MLEGTASLLRGALSLVLLSSNFHPLSAFAQEHPIAHPFDVVIVREHRPDDDKAMNMGWRGGSYFASAAPLEVLLMNAFSLRENHIKGLKGWENGKRWDLLAKWSDWSADEADALSSAAKQAALQGLLTSAFTLRMHREIREEAGYELVVGSSGARLEEHANLQAILDGRSGGTWHYGVGTIDVVALSVKGFLFPLENKLGHPVVDRTGLTGLYDLHLRWTELADAGSALDSGPSLVTALKEQTGLELRPTKVPVEVHVIDSATRPEAP
jgi:uncharacterized protein (TIGR03435 family)